MLVTLAPSMSRITKVRSLVPPCFDTSAPRNTPGPGRFMSTKVPGGAGALSPCVRRGLQTPGAQVAASPCGRGGAFLRFAMWTSSSWHVGVPRKREATPCARRRRLVKPYASRSICYSAAADHEESAHAGRAPGARRHRRDRGDLRGDPALLGRALRLLASAPSRHASRLARVDVGCVAPGLRERHRATFRLARRRESEGPPALAHLARRAPRVGRERRSGGPRSRHLRQLRACESRQPRALGSPAPAAARGEADGAAGEITLDAASGPRSPSY